MSIWLSVELTAQQRVSLGTGGERVFLTRSHPFIPGSTLRGALASSWKLAGRTFDAAFSYAFERGRFGPALPTWADVEPLSVNRCKYHSDENSDGYADLAFGEDLCCPCKNPDSLKGGYTRARPPDASIRLMPTVTTTALVPGKHVARDEHLFSRETIERGTVFSGHVVLPDDVSQDILSTLTSLTTVIVGGRGSTLGRCSIAVKQLVDPPGDERNNTRVVLRTLTPTFLVDDAGFPSGDLGNVLREQGLGVASRLWAGRLVTDSGGGWHMASGLPKPMEIGIAPGATAVLESPDPGALRRVLDRGLGLRRSEGYGWVTVVHNPWRPPEVSQSPAAETRSPAVAERTSWRTHIDDLRLTSEQRQWLAGKLRLTLTGHVLNASELREAAVKRLTTIQRDGDSTHVGIIAVVRDVPSRERNSLAHAMTKGGQPR